MHLRRTFFPVDRLDISAIPALPTQFDLLLTEATTGSSGYTVLRSSQALEKRDVLVSATSNAVSSTGFPAIPDTAKE